MINFFLGLSTIMQPAVNPANIVGRADRFDIQLSIVQDAYLVFRSPVTRLEKDCDWTGP